MTKQDVMVNRDPIDPATVRQDIEDIFTFNPAITVDQVTACLEIQNACKSLALMISENVPEGKEQTIAINNLLATALWAKQGITRRQIGIVVTAPVEIQTEEPPTLAQEAQALKDPGEKWFT